MPKAKHKIFGEGFADNGRLAAEGVLPDGGTFSLYEPKPTPEVDLSPENMDAQIQSRLKKRGEHVDYLKKRFGLPDKRPSYSERNISSLVDKTTKEKEKGLFEHVFGDQARYEDRKYLPTKAQNAWTNELLKMRRRIDVRLKEEFEIEQAEYDEKKKVVDEEVKAYDAYEKMYKPEKPEFDIKDISKYYSSITKPNQYDEIPEIRPDQIDALNYMIKNSNRPDLTVVDGKLVPKDFKPYPLSDEEITEILKGSGYKVTPESIKSFKTDNPGG